MTRADTAQIKAKIEKAKQRLDSAEEAMASALKQLEAAPRVDKTFIGSVLGTAFAELKAAKHEVLELEKQITRDA